MSSVAFEPDRNAWYRALGWWSACLVFAALATWWLCGAPACGASQLDHLVLSFSNAMRSTHWDTFFAVVTWGGSLKLLLPLVGLIAGNLLRMGRYRAAVFSLLSLVGSSAWVHAVKLIVARPRPALFDAVVAMPADYAYPSAHTAQIVAFVVALAYLQVSGRHWRRIALLTVGIVAALTIAFSRIYLQVHYPSDVLVGAGLAAFWVAGLAQLMHPGRGTRA